MNSLVPSDINPAARAVIKRKLRTLCQSPRWAAPGDRDDVGQELAVHAHVITPRFDPSRGSPLSFFERAMTNHLRDLRSKARAGCRDWRRSVPLSQPEEIVGRSTRRGELQLDVQHALRQAPPMLQRFAQELCCDTLAAAARRLGLSRQQARHQRELLARHFTACGLDPRGSSN